jgi:hypothetical protein
MCLRRRLLRWVLPHPPGLYTMKKLAGIAGPRVAKWVVTSVWVLSELERVVVTVSQACRWR